MKFKIVSEMQKHEVRRPRASLKPSLPCRRPQPNPKPKPSIVISPPILLKRPFHQHAQEPAFPSAKMPATRRSRVSSGPAAKGSQKTLAFTNSKVTKPTHAPTGKDALLASSKPAAPAAVEEEAEVVDIDVGHTSSEAATAQQTRTELSAKHLSPSHERASAISDAQIKKYWRDREAERKAPRVHQQDLSVEEKVLRLFDMSSQFGPCIGIARMKRWTRASKLGLNPPIEVLAVLLKEAEKGNSTTTERAHVDELMSSTPGE
ncbi:uncharacterized protein BP5553_04771 [Venustampulla echinocandica]|uniref:DNA polymerase delta subunit 4 n=1 Tax=Venustampulla echinocandica TaxID=2656787 RepID=A0A370TPA8_9HELO|nr:uncharacterized protein BP5553_04771 [Venustampulla echinocandica]RDL37338.1 hypothetical protein BP5553_04771 [Venustampulla echinocandica]